MAPEKDWSLQRLNSEIAKAMKSIYPVFVSAPGKPFLQLPPLPYHPAPSASTQNTLEDTEPISPRQLRTSQTQSHLHEAKTTHTNTTTEKVPKATFSPTSNTTSSNEEAYTAYQASALIHPNLRSRTRHLERLHNILLKNTSNLKRLHIELFSKHDTLLEINVAQQVELLSAKFALRSNEEGMTIIRKEKIELEIKCDELEKKNNQLMFHKAGMEEEIMWLRGLLKRFEDLYGDIDEAEALHG